LKGIFRSKESYYQILRNANLTWHKGNKENPRKNPARIKERNKELAAILRDRRGICFRRVSPSRR